ncbi:MAG TPA: universal stress protein [Solirubrobacteraceae bacterium]|jgi:nucleotide-binding universal stress UspA family protein
MSANIIISYDGTYNEDDAVALGRVFADAGAEVSLAYVRHAPEAETSREILAQHEAETLLERGSEILGNADTPRHVVTDRSTPEGLSALAEKIGADAVVFCSDSHTAKGSIAVGNSAQRLLNGGSVAVAIAPAGFAQSASTPRTVGVVGNGSAHESAEALAGALGAELITGESQRADLLVVGSRPEAEEGRVSLSAASENVVENATSPVLVLPRGRALAFRGTVAFTA